MPAIANDPHAKELGQKFGDALRRALLTQNQAAAAMKVPESHVTEMVQGKRPIPLHRLTELGWRFYAEFNPEWNEMVATRLLALQLERGSLHMARVEPDRVRAEKVTA